MGKEIRWLWAESKQWVDRGLISDEQASRIRGLYPDPKAGLPWSTIIFSGLGGATQCESQLAWPSCLAHV